MERILKMCLNEAKSTMAVAAWDPTMKKKRACVVLRIRRIPYLTGLERRIDT